MATDTTDSSGPTDSSPESNARTLPGTLASGGKAVLYGFLAAVGTLLVANGVRTYLEYAEGGVNQPVLYLVGVLVVLTVGFTLLFVALSGAVARGVARTRRE